jgi:hypothetical protein
MKALRYFVIFFTSILALAVFFLWYVGIFDQLKLSKTEMPEYLVAGISIKGSYQQIGPSFERVDSLLAIHNVSSQIRFGVYYNDPANTPEAELESFVGCVLKAQDFTRLDAIETKEIKLDKIPAGEALSVEMDIRSDLSYMIGPIRAYPVLEAAAERDSLDIALVYELYKLDEEKAQYTMLILN